MKTTIILSALAVSVAAFSGFGIAKSEEPAKSSVVTFDMDEKFADLQNNDHDTADNFCKYLGAKGSVFYLSAGYHRSDQPSMGGFSRNTLGCKF